MWIRSALNSKMLAKFATWLVFAFILSIVLNTREVRSGTPSTDSHLTRIQPRDVLVLDGDTIRIGTNTYRLMGFDTPETFQAKCQYERVIGEGATDRLIELISQSQRLELDTRGRDKYKRILTVLYVNGLDVANIMIGEGHAVPYDGRTKRIDWCAQAPQTKSDTTTTQPTETQTKKE